MKKCEVQFLEEKNHSYGTQIYRKICVRDILDLGLFYIKQKQFPYLFLKLFLKNPATARCPSPYLLVIYLYKHQQSVFSVGPVQFLALHLGSSASRQAVRAKIRRFLPLIKHFYVLPFSQKLEALKKQLLLVYVL